MATSRYRDSMALLLILFGVLVAGVLADFLIENDIATAATQPLTMAGVTVDLSTPVVAAIAFGLGALAVLLIVAGIRRMGRKRRRVLKERIANLEHENARLITKENLPNVIRIPDSAPLAETEQHTEAAAAEIPPTPGSGPGQSSQGSTPSRWA